MGKTISKQWQMLTFLPGLGDIRMSEALSKARNTASLRRRLRFFALALVFRGSTARLRQQDSNHYSIVPHVGRLAMLHRQCQFKTSNMLHRLE